MKLEKYVLEDNVHFKLVCEGCNKVIANDEGVLQISDVCGSKEEYAFFHLQCVPETLPVDAGYVSLRDFLRDLTTHLRDLVPSSRMRAVRKENLLKFLADPDADASILRLEDVAA